MMKPKAKTLEELTAEIEDGQKKIRQYENREKRLRQKLSREERRERNHRLIVWGAVFESIVPEAKDMTDEEAPRYDWRLCRRQGKLLCGSHLHSRCVPTSGTAAVGEYKKRRSRQLRLKPTRCMKKASVLNSLSNAVRTLALVRMKGFEPTLF